MLGPSGPREAWSESRQTAKLRHWRADAQVGRARMNK